MSRLARAMAPRRGEWALVTGASDGIGRACAGVLAEQGANLVLVSRRELALDTFAHELRSRFEIEVEVVALDLGGAGAVARLDAQTHQIDISTVVAAAGFGSVGPLLSREPLEELAMVDLNVRSVLELSYRFGQRLVAREGGALVLFGSIVGFQGVPLSSNYAATKAYVQSLAEALAAEWSTYGVRVLCAAPGPVETGFARRARMNLGAADDANAVAREIVARLGSPGTIRPGLRGKLLGWALSPAPRALRSRILHGVMRKLARSTTHPMS